MKSLKLIVAVLVGGVFLAVGYTVAMSGEIPATITVKDPAFTTLKKTPVPFSHEKHFKDMNIACTDCHHIFKDGKNVWKEGDPVKKCSECHKPVATEKNSLTFCKKAYPAGKAPGLKCAYHMNCIACHKKAKEAGKKRAPTECSKCHPIQK
jgi:hypothetical protein